MKVSRIFFLILSVLLTFIIYEKFPKYLDQEKYIKILFLSVFLCFSILSTFIKNKFIKKINIFFIYFVIITYSLNLLLSVHHYFNSTEYKKEKRYKELDINFDYRDPLTFIKDSGNNRILPLTTPSELMKKNEDVLFLSGVTNSQYIQCNEFGQWKKITTDNYGFNNSSIKSKYKILLIGDSFAHGVCVEKQNETHNLLTKKGLSTYNAGYSGNGPLLTLATAIEINKVLEADKIVWLFFRNDFYDIKWESKNYFLKKYLDKNFNGFSYFNNLEKKDNYQKNYIKNNYSKTHGFNYKESFIQLKFLNDYIKKALKKNKIENYDEKIIDKVFSIFSTILRDKKKIIIYLPDQACFLEQQHNCKKEFSLLKKIASKNNLEIHNYTNAINSKLFKEYFALGINRNHYSNKGYMDLSDYIFNILKSDLN